MIAMNPSVDQNMKKKSRTTPNSSDPNKKSRVSPYELRWGTESLEELMDLQYKCADAIQRIGNALNDAKQIGLPEIFMDGCTQLRRATTMLETFNGHLHTAVNKARVDAELQSRKANKG